MIEKRFSQMCASNDYCIGWDNKLDEGLSIDDTIKMLNKLSKENEQLKKDGLYWGQNAEARLKEIDKLRKDNTILKQQRDYLFDVIDEVLPHSGSTTVYNRMKNIGDVE